MTAVRKGSQGRAGAQPWREGSVGVRSLKGLDGKGLAEPWCGDL